MGFISIGTVSLLCIAKVRQVMELVSGGIVCNLSVSGFTRVCPIPFSTLTKGCRIPRQS